MEPMFSIVVPTRDRAKIIAPTLESIRAQSFEDFECVVVDDGGSDGTAQVVQSLRDSRFRYVWKSHGERGAARNHGVRFGRGRYVYFLDSDDRLTPNALADVAAFMAQKQQPAVVVSRCARITSAGVLSLPPWRYDENYQSGLFRQNRGAGYAYVRREVALELPFFEHEKFSFGEDWAFALRLAVRHRFEISPTIDRLCLEHARSTMATASPERVLLSTDILLSILRSDEQFMARAADSIPIIEAEMVSLAGLHFALSGQRSRAMACLVRALAASPRGVGLARGIAVLRRSIWSGGR